MLKWEPLQSDNQTLFVSRSKVFGGWLVSATMDVRSAVNTGYNQPDYTTGYEWRTSITFVPDHNHEWNIKDNL